MQLFKNFDCGSYEDWKIYELLHPHILELINHNFMAQYSQIGLAVTLCLLGKYSIERCQDLQAEQLNMRFELMILVMLSWRWDLPIDLYPGAPPDTDQG
jgi:hypothetical protein